MRIEERLKGGLPYGVYDVAYYRVRNGEAVIMSDRDSGVSSAHVGTLHVMPDEIAVAHCRSQPGGMIVYGSYAARSAFRKLGDIADQCPRGVRWSRR